MASRIIHGAAIKALRMALGLRQDALAERAGISKSYLSRIENGVESPEMNATTHRLKDALGVPIDAITYPVPDTVPDSMPLERTA